jgi:hypothetical protein
VALLLPGDIAPHRLNLGLADAEHRVAGLPGEGSIAAAYPGRRAGLDDSYGVGRSDIGRQRKQQMDMVGDAVNQESFSTEVADNASHIGKQFVSPVLLEGRPALLGREDDMQEDLRESLSHESAAPSGLLRCWIISQGSAGCACGLPRSTLGYVPTPHRGSTEVDEAFPACRCRPA